MQTVEPHYIHVEASFLGKLNTGWQWVRARVGQLITDIMSEFDQSFRKPIADPGGRHRPAPCGILVSRNEVNLHVIPDLLRAAPADKGTSNAGRSRCAFPTPGNS